MNLADNVVVFVNPDEATGVNAPQPPTPAPQPQSTLRSVHKRLAKPWRRAIPMQPLPPPPKFYRVDSINFRKVVQQLTGAPEIRSQRLHSVATPALDQLAPPSHSDHTCKSRAQQQLFITPEQEGSSSSSSSSSSLSLSALTIPAQVNLGMNNDWLGPLSSSVSWPHSFTVLSPGTLASLEQSSDILY